MNKSKRIAISLVAGVLAALLCMVYGSSIRSQAERVQAETLAKYGGDRVEVCVAARDIDVGETLDETNVITQEWLTSLLPRDAATELRQVRGDVTDFAYSQKRRDLQCLHQGRGPQARGA